MNTSPCLVLYMFLMFFSGFCIKYRYPVLHKSCTVFSFFAKWGSRYLFLHTPMHILDSLYLVWHTFSLYKYTQPDRLLFLVFV